MTRTKFAVVVSFALGILSVCPSADAKIIGNYAVPYLRQRDYTGIGESACGPTSTAMILQYYYRNSQIGVREIYHAGLQMYGFNGPATKYRNQSYQSPDSPWYPPDSAQSAQYYSNKGDSRMRGNAVLQNYLQSTWQIDTTVLNSADQVYSALESGPLIGHVWAHGYVNVWGHYLVILGIDNKDTASRTDDEVIVHDPYDIWNSAWDTGGRYKRISYQKFFVTGARFGGAWFRDAIRLTPRDTVEQRQYTVVVDGGHSPVSGNASFHRFEVDNIEDFVGNSSMNLTWWLNYGAEGDWVYPTENGHIARWTPYLPVSACYDVSTSFRGDSVSGNVTYVVYDAGGVERARTTINQYRGVPTWVRQDLATNVRLSNGAYVRAIDISANSKIDNVKFKYRGSNCAGAPPAPSGVGATDGTYSDRVRVTWYASSGATGYEVWRGTSSSSSSAIGLVTTTALSFDDWGATPGTTYYYWVKAKSTVGTSGFSASNSGFRAASVPVAPTGVNATDGTFSDRIRVTWSASNGASGYEVWRGTSSSSSAAIGLTTTTALSFDDWGAAAGTTYYYWVKAKNTAGRSGFSASNSGFRAASVPTAPTGVNATDGAYSDRVRVTWYASNGATGYEVWRGTSSSLSSAVGIFTTTSMSFDDFGVTAGTTYYYWVKAKNSVGTSGFSTSDSGRRSYNTFYASPSWTTVGGGNLGGSNLFTLSVTIYNGKIAYFSVRKTDGSKFSSSGTMSLKVGGYQHDSFTRAQKPVWAGLDAIPFDADDFNNYPANTYPKQYFVRYEVAGTTGYQWCGPITIYQGN